MGQLEELKLFIFERLHVVTNEILAAIEKSIAEYEDEVSRLKEENVQCRPPPSDIIVPPSIPTEEGGCI